VSSQLVSVPNHRGARQRDLDFDAQARPVSADRRSRRAARRGGLSLEWKWLFIYPKQKIASVNELAVPVGTPVRFSTGMMPSE
jgi:heme/copper-type cytochrome/quinol oxidase subunit 2